MYNNHRFHRLPVSGIIVLIVAAALFSEETKKPELTIKKSDLAAIDKRYHETIVSSGIIIQENALVEYVESIIEKLAGNSPSIKSGYRIVILDGSEPNAFALSDGTIYINLSIFGMASNEAQLALLLAHEIAHIENDHHLGLNYEMIEQSSDILYHQMFAWIFCVPIGGGYWLRSALSGFSIRQEKEADSIACISVYHGGYNPWEAKKFMKTMHTWLVHKEKNYRSVAATHPKLLTRYTTMNRWVATMQADSTKGSINDERYQEVIGPYYERIIELLTQSNCVNELKALVDERFAAGDSSPRWRNLRGKLLERYWPVDSFAVASRELAKGYMSGSHDGSVFRTLGLLYLKNNMHDRAKICLTRYLESVPDSPDASIITFYLDQMNK